MSDDMTIGLVAVFFVASALVAMGAFIAVWRRDAAAALCGVPLMFGGAGVALAGVARFSARAAAAVQTPSAHVVVGVSGPPIGQEAAVLIAIASLALVALGLGLAARSARLPGGRQEASR